LKKQEISGKLRNQQENETMLRLKIYKNELLLMPEVELTGNNTMELMDPYLRQCPLTAKYQTIYGRLRRAARYAGIPMWGILRNKAMQSSAFLVDQMVKLGMAEWLEFNEEEFNPRTAIGKMRNTRLNQHPKTEEHLEKLRQSHAVMYKNMTEEQKEKRSAALKAGWAKRRENPNSPPIKKEITPEHRANIKAAKQKQFAEMTEEQKAERSAALKAGWAKRRERLAAEAEAKKQEEYRQKLIAAGRLPASDDQIPAWFKMPENN
jgi:hypothetical protein